jgi:hypothetical protein
MERPPSTSASVALSVPGSVALLAIAAIFLILGIAVGRSCAPVTCVVGKNEFKAKVTICDDGKAYSLVVQPESEIVNLTTTATEADIP